MAILATGVLGFSIGKCLSIYGMKVTIKNCNNIDAGEIEIVDDKLNIKFGINGTGKSTIAKAIKFKVDSPDKMANLKPFKLLESKSNLEPEVTISEEIESVFIFDEEYLSQFLYKEDELIQNSFEVFIKTPNYIESIEKIESILEHIKKIFAEKKELEKIISDFESLSKSFTTTKSGDISKTSAVYRGLKDGNKIENIPTNLIGYKSFLQSKDCTSWLDWHIKAEKFIDLSDDCPYCASSTVENKEVIKSVTDTYDKNIIRNFTAIIEAIDNLGIYFSDDAKRTLESITKKPSGLEDGEIDYIKAVKQQIDNLLFKLKALKSISPLSFEDGEQAQKQLKDLKIDLDLFDRFKSEKSMEIVSSLNDSLELVLTQIGVLQGEINKQKSQTKKLIEEHQSNINAFLNYAGYKYEVAIDDDEKGDYKLKLRHLDSIKKISGGNQHLSFGERNAFALVLFMYQALAKNPDLIVLDDPISSFDKNKKYAILHKLFRGDSEKCIKRKRVLMLTHDLEPVIDTVKALPEFVNLAESKFLYINDGKLAEKDIENDDLKSFPQICKRVLDSVEEDEIVKLVYLRRRYEIIDDKGDEYQVLSNLFHKRSKAKAEDHRKICDDLSMDEAQFDAGVQGIKENLRGFDYDVALKRLLDVEELKRIYNSSSNSYAKLQLFRLIYKKDTITKVLEKFIAESYHIENELICQLDPFEFDLVPSYVLEECDKYVASIGDLVTN